MTRSFFFADSAWQLLLQANRTFFMFAWQRSPSPWPEPLASFFSARRHCTAMFFTSSSHDFAHSRLAAKAGDASIRASSRKRMAE